MSHQALVLFIIGVASSVALAQKPPVKVSTIPPGQQGPAKIPVLVKAAATVGGFTDPSKVRQDSTKDLVNKLRESRTVRLVESESEALVVLEVLGRETRREVNAWAAFGSGAQNKSYLTVRLTAGEYATEFTADGGSSGLLTGYGKAAGKIAKQFEAWVKENRDKILALKK